MKIEINENKKWQQSLTIKIILLAIMGLFLLIPVEMIKSIINERFKNSEKVRKEISFQWAEEQTLSGPVLNIPVRVFPSNKGEEPYRIIFHIMPETLNITGTTGTEIRHKSIYQAVVYTSDLLLSGEFVLPELTTSEKSEILWSEAYYALGISDNRGLKGSVELKTDSSVNEAVPGVKDTDIFKSGISFPAELNEQDKKIKYSLKLSLSGSAGLSFSPVGKSTKVNLASSWNSPGFTGNFLPVERSIAESGFKAEWQVTDLNRSFPQLWTGNAYRPENDAFGVDFILPVEHYQKSLRSAKYGILFIALTFLALLFTEMTIKAKLHIFHYLLVSLALVLFFSLLSALSEQVGFNIAYLISTVSIITLITVFLRMLVSNYRPVLMLSLMLILLYSFIFILLTLNDYAYLAGNIGLFILLAITMMLSVKLKLFGNGEQASINE
jgi:inner membrane protein